jgi:hypothetical protein
MFFATKMKGGAKVEKKIYKLKPKCEKYNLPVNGSEKSFHDFQLYINKSRVEKALKTRKELVKKYKKPNSFVLILKLLALYYALVGFIILLSKLGL